MERGKGGRGAKSFEHSRLESKEFLQLIEKSHTSFEWRITVF